MSETPPAIDCADWSAHAAFVRRIARSLVEDPADADDLAQEAWLAWHRAPPDRPRALRSWLARVVTNLARMRARTASRRVARERAITGHDDVASAAHAVERVELHRRVVERVLALAEPFRSVIVLRFHEQLSLGEIAQRLGVPLETVKSRQKRALQQLRQQLLGDDDDAGERRRALLLLVHGAGGLVMSSGTKWAIGVGAALLVAGIAARPWLAPARHELPETSGVAGAPADAAMEEPPRPAAVAAMRLTEPSREAVHPSASAPSIVRGSAEARIHGDVLDEAGRPLPGRRVELYERRVSHDVRDQSLLASTLTDAEGRFEFAPTPFERRVTATVIAWDGASSVGTSIDPRQAPAIHLVIGATKSIVGRVVDTRGNAVPGATLFAGARFRSPRLEDGYFVPAGLAPLATTRCSPDGTFRLDGLQHRWTVTLDVTCDGLASYRETIHLDESPRDHEVTIVMRPGCRVEGLVKLADGTAAAAVRVGAQLQDGDSLRMRNSWGDALTDAQGRYRIDSLEAGSWNVLVSLDPEQQKEWCAAPAQQVALTDDARLAHADFVLPVGGELVVRVTDSDASTPVAELWIGVLSAATSRSGAAIQAVWTDDDGIARLRLPAGEFSAYLGPEVIEPSWGRREGTIVEGETLEWSLEVGRGTTLRGRVLLPDGGPAADAVVWTHVPRRRSGDPVKAITRNDGTFELSSLPRQDPCELLAATTGASLREPLIVRLEVDDVDRLELHLTSRPDTRLTGTVVDPAGQPIAGAELYAAERLADASRREVVTPDPAHRAISDADGSFEFRGLWCDAGYHLSAYWLDQRDGRADAHLADEEIAPLAPTEERELGELVLRRRDDRR